LPQRLSDGIWLRDVDVSVLRLRVSSRIEARGVADELGPSPEAAHGRSAAMTRATRPESHRGTRYLVACRACDRVVVGGIEGGGARVDKLASIGILPGVELRVQQTRPVVVVELDGAVLALDREMAGCVQATRADHPNAR